MELEGLKPASATRSLPPLEIITSWTGTDKNENAPDSVRQTAPARDHLFRLRVLQVMQEQAPWLIRLLQEARAKVVAGPGLFLVMFGDDPARHVKINALGQHLLLLPWREDGQEVQ